MIKYGNQIAKGLIIYRNRPFSYIWSRPNVVILKDQSLNYYI